MRFQYTLCASQRAHNYWRRARSAAEGVCIELILIAAPLQITIATASHLASPSLSVNQSAVIGEVEPRAVGSPNIASMGSGRRRASPHYNGARIPVAAVKGIGPRSWKEGRSSAIDWIVEVFSAIAGGFDYYNPLVYRITNCIEVVRPPFNCDVAALICAPLKVKTRAGAVDLQQYDVAFA